MAFFSVQSSCSQYHYPSSLVKPSSDGQSSYILITGQMYHATAQVQMHAYGLAATCPHIRLTALPSLLPVPATVSLVMSYHFPSHSCTSTHSHGPNTDICHANALRFILRPRCGWLGLLLAYLFSGSLLSVLYVFSTHFCFFLLGSGIFYI
jgi:hypothetical protein